MFANYADVAALVVGLVLPVIVALFTKRSTSSTAKGIAHAVLSLATGFYAVYRAHPQSLYWAPAVVASFLAWMSGTGLYHSLLKRYAWFAWVQDALVHDTKNTVLADYIAEVEQAAAAAPISNNFPLSTDLRGAVSEITQVPAVQSIVHAVEQHVVAPIPAAVPAPTVVLPAYAAAPTPSPTPNFTTGQV